MVYLLGGNTLLDNWANMKSRTLFNTAVSQLTALGLPLTYKNYLYQPPPVQSAPGED